MGQFLRVNGDYNIKTADGATIILDTGPAASGGQVRVTGNLVVEGETTTVAAENLNVEDNIILVNYYGDDRTSVPAGVALRYAGLQVDRGSLSTSGIFYDELEDAWLFAQGGPSIIDGVPATPFNYNQSRIKVKEVRTDSTTDTGDLTLIGTGTGVVKITGTTNYTQEIIDRDIAADPEVDDILTNKGYVDFAILNNPTFQIVAPNLQDTKVVISDKDLEAFPPDSNIPGSPAYLSATTTASSFGQSAVSILVDGTLIGQFYNNRFEVGDLEIGGGVDRNEITTKASITNENIVIRTQGTGKLQTNYAIQLERIGTSGETPPLAFPNIPLTPAYVPGSTLIYAASPGIGNTGLYFTNDSIIASYRSGELISKNKALVFSMIF